MPISTSRNLPLSYLIPALAASLLAPAALRAATIQAGDVTNTLGPTFFLDEAVNGGSDTDLNQPGVAVLLRAFNGLLSPNQGPTRVVLTGFGFALHTSDTANDATSVTVAFTYLGADEAVGGSDDVVIGTATGNLNFTGGGEYVFAFDTPLTANLDITGTRFRITITPSNATSDGSLKIKSLNPGSWPYAPYVSVAGVASTAINPQRLNLAKFQPVTTDSVSGQRLASYVTDGVTGNDNRWESTGAGPHWARVDFPFPVEVGSAQLLTGTDDANPITNFDIQYLNVYNGTWVNIPGASVTGNTNVERGFVFDPPISASSFRVHSPDNTVRLRELALYPPNGPGGYPIGTDLTTNLAYQRPAVATANTAGNFARNAVDGRRHVGSTWQTNTAGINTLDIDLRVSTKIGSAHLYSGSNGVLPLGSFVMKYWDGAAWQNITGGTVTGNTTSDLVIPFTPVTTSQVRLEFTNPGTTSIRELCVFPANAGNVGYPIGTNLINSGAVGNYETYNDAFHLITNSASNRKMSVPNSGQPALDPNGLTFGQSQYQVLLNLSNGTYRLHNRATGNCLSGATLDQTPGLPLIDANYSALPHQDWIIDPVGGGKFRFVNQWSGLVIDTQGSATAPGTLLVQNEANGSATQRWQISKYAWAPKKGIGGTTFAMATNPKWAYNWGRLNTQTIPADAPFFPMQWGNFSWDIGSGQGPIWQEYPNWRRRADGIHVLGFNEPDGYDQSGKYLDPTIPPTKEEFSWERSMAEAVRLWPRLQELDMPLVSPAPAGKDNGWLAGFYTQAANLGYRVDYTAVHTYPSPNGGSSQNLINFVQDAYDDWDRPVWLTEFSFVDWNKNQTWSEEDNYNCLAEFLWRAESLTALRKYALFVFTENAEWPQPANSWTAVTPAPRSNSYDINGNLTAFGKLYAAWDSDTTVGTDKTYMIHNRGLRKRMANAATTNTAPGGRTIRTDGPIVNWTLVSTGVSNRYYVVSSIDGRRLSYIANSTTNPNNDPALAAPGTIGTAVEWSLTESQHGWHYLGHPQTNTRLKLLSFNTSNNVADYQLVSAGTTDNNTQWRFIVPLISNTAPVLTAITPQTADEGTQLTFIASATDADLPADTLTYSLIGAPVGASINSATGVFSWTPAENQAPGNFSFTVRASDGTLTHDQQVSVIVNEVNLAPVLAAIPPQSVNEGNLLTFTASATDSDLPANTLTYSLVGAPVGASINGGTGLFTWTPRRNQSPGAFNFTVRVSDGSLTHDQALSVTVNEANAAPVLASIPPQVVDEGELLTFAASATDDGLPANTLTYSLIGAPAGAAINGSNGVFEWTPAESQGPGTFSFTVRVDDGDLTHDQAVSVTVNEVNTAPVLTAIPPKTVNEGTQLTFTASATDADLPANTLTYSLIGGPAGASITSGTGVFIWTPAETQGPGTFNFTVRISDGILTHDQPVTVSVTDDGGADHLETYIVAGQSNAEGYGITENPINGLVPADTLATIGRSDLNVTHNFIQMFQGANENNGITTSGGMSLPPKNAWHAMTASEGLAFDWGSGRGNESRRRFGPELAFGYDVQRQLGSPIALIKYARGSTSIAPSTEQSSSIWRDFDPSDGGRLNQYDKLISTIQAAVDSLPAGQVLKMRGVVWMQGESDATAANAPVYQANLAELIASLRADIGSIAAASGGRMTRSAASWSELDVFVGTVRNTNTFRQTVINAQNAVAAADPNVFTVDGTNGLSVMTFDDWGGSGVHYDTAGQVLLGERFADAAISRIVLVTESGGATSVTEDGATDTYTVSLTRAPSADVTINITTDSQVSVSPASLTFTTGNWATPQTVTVTAVNDTVDESNHFGSITHDLSSLDLSFGGLPTTGVTATVIDNDANSAPVLTAIPPQTVTEGNLLTFTASATDDGLPANTLTYSLIGAPAGASINGSTGVFTWTPSEAQGPGSFNFSARVSDGNLTHDQPVFVIVESPLPSSEVDMDGDGLSDLLEYAFLTDPGIPNGTPFKIRSHADGAITLEFPWNWQAGGISWRIRHGHDLSNISAWPVVAPGTITTNREGDIDHITVTPAMAYPDRGFYILEVIGD